MTREPDGARRRAFAAMLLAALLACEGAGAPEAPPPVLLDPATVTVQASVAATNVALVTVTVTGDGIPKPAFAPLALSAGVATGSVQAPPGAARVVTVRAYDAQGVETHRGAITAALEEGRELRLTVSVGALAGSVAIEVRAGEYAVTIGGAPASLAVGASARLSAGVVAPGGAAVEGAPIVWASSNAGVASVDASGTVTARHAGLATIVASYRGFAAAAPLEVVP